MQNYKYFAFISYKREDEEWAKWLQNELENYHLPTTLNGIDDLPKSFRPVFRDTDELEAGDLSEQIQNALEKSLNLIVVCSPKSASSKWVNLEINTFINLERRNNIDRIAHVFPFIIEGIPYSEDKRLQCFPQVLIDLREIGRERIGGNINEGSREKAFVKVLAGMLPKEITFDMLWNRYEREKIEVERKTREQNYKLLKAQGRAVAHHAKNAISAYNSFLARRLALEVIEQNINYNIDILPEVESILRFSSNNDSSILNGHVAGVRRAIYNSDNSLIASCSDDKSIILWDESKGYQIRRLIGHNSSVTCISFGNTSNTLFSGSVDGTIYQWDILQGEHRLIVQEEFSIISFVYLKQQDLIVYYAGHGEVKFIDYKTRRIIHVMNHIKGTVNSISANSSCTLLAISASTNIIILDLISFEPTIIKTGHDKDITSISFSSDEKSILSTSRDGTIKLWNIKEKVCYHHLVGHNGVVWDAKFHPSNSQVVSVSSDCNLCIWDITKNTFEITPSPNSTIVFPQIHKKQIYSVLYNNEGTKLLTASLDTSVRNLSLITNKNLSKYTSINCKINCILSSESLHDIIIGDSLGRLIFFDPINLKINKITKTANTEINSLAYNSKTHTLIISSMADYEISFFCLETEQICHKIKHVCSKCCSIDDVNNILYFDDGNEIAIYSIDTKRIVGRLTGHTQHVNCVCCDTNKPILYSSSSDCTIRVWNLVTFECIKILRNNLLETTQIAISQDGNYLAIASADNNVVIQDSTSYNVISTLHHNGKITAIRFFKNGKNIATSSWDKNLCIWDVESGELLNSYYHVTLPKPDNYICVDTPLESIINDSWITNIGILEDNNTIYSSSVLGYFYAWKYERKEVLLEEFKHQFTGTSFNDDEKKMFYLI